MRTPRTGSATARTAQSGSDAAKSNNKSSGNARACNCNCQDSEYRAIFNSNPHPMWIYDIDTLTISDVNDAALKQYGYSRREFVGMCIVQLRPEEEQEKFAQHIRQPF